MQEMVDTATPAIRYFHLALPVESTRWLGLSFLCFGCTLSIEPCRPAYPYPLAAPAMAVVIATALETSIATAALRLPAAAVAVAVAVANDKIMSA